MGGTSPRAPSAPERTPLPKRFCNLERLLHAMQVRDLDGIVATSMLNVFYLSGFNSIAHKSDEPRVYAVILSRHAPDHPIFVLADYYLGSLLSQPTWIEDVRPFRAVMMPLDLPPAREDVDRFIPAGGAGESWVGEARERYVFDMGEACRGAIRDLRLEGGRIAFDDPSFGHRLGLESTEIVDGYDPLMFARAVKSEAEIALLRRATALNQRAIERTVDAWQRGMSWREFNHAYHCAVTELGGFVRDPGGMVWGHPRGGDAAINLQTGLEDFAVEPGMHVMFDCHGTVDLYCWDGGKTWVVDGEPEGDAARNARAVAAAGETLLAAMRPGARVSELQAAARATFRKAGVPDADAAVIFFHGLGLSHWDIERTTADGRANRDWALEEGMVVPLHLLYPGDEHQRIWLEEVALITRDGGEPLFSWGLEPMTAG
ncbi:MAG: M24 family metallopeptidase [Gammaproteobacteria bacterium]|nr:M24 family metallopeptidase [Gammaproteobacteria bacterium]NIP89122.1 M24 family metallopeptidase [Gammaproteobacteria bacterium]NIR23981.1 M24 family metallopeptidase [Gammaproteobacteria bacterium]NIS05616.1 M24 family metallopeptidase [Gammaproteobacteria bacterium]NIU40930.1 M24 family metallopeptidase [Gammaproteobacteria bacterium]